jgi:hypothetical protein
VANPLWPTVPEELPPVPLDSALEPPPEELPPGLVAKEPELLDEDPPGQAQTEYVPSGWQTWVPIAPPGQAQLMLAPGTQVLVLVEQAPMITRTPTQPSIVDLKVHPIL